MSVGAYWSVEACWLIEAYWLIEACWLVEACCLVEARWSGGSPLGCLRLTLLAGAVR